MLTDDHLLTEAVTSRIPSDVKNVSILPSIEALTDLVNAINSEVTEQFFQRHRKQAEEFLFKIGDQSCLYMHENVGAELSKKFSAVLVKCPAGSTQRRNGTWLVDPPTFMAKAGDRVTWRTRIQVPAEAYKLVRQPVHVHSTYKWSPSLPEHYWYDRELDDWSNFFHTDYPHANDVTPLSGTNTPVGRAVTAFKKAARPSRYDPIHRFGEGDSGISASQKMPVVAFPNIGAAQYSFTPATPTYRDKLVLASRGYDAFGATWSVTLEDGRFSDPKIEKLEHLETAWNQP